MATALQPAFTWSTSVTGASIPNGLLTAPNTSGTLTVTATVTGGTLSGTSAVNVTDHAPTVATPASGKGYIYLPYERCQNSR